MWDAISAVMNSFNNFLWGWFMIILLLGTHIFLTIRTKFLQRKTFKAIKLSVSQHQRTAPGPPSAIAVPTPMILPVPIVEASAVARA